MKNLKNVGEVKVNNLKEFFDKYIPGASRGQREGNAQSVELSLFFGHLRDGEYLRSRKALELRNYCKVIVNEYNDSLPTPTL